jgi:nucleoside-diphosphate-sugar epimerase
MPGSSDQPQPGALSRAAAGESCASARRLPDADLNHILRHTQGLWDELRNARLFVTGGSGFFGRWMLESLLWANRKLDLGLEAVVLTRDPVGFRQKAPHLTADPVVTLQAGDVRDFRLPDGEFTDIVHLAAETNTDMTDPPARVYYDVIVHGTERVLQLAASSGARRLLLASSGAVYGSQPGDVELMPEDCGYAPLPQDLRAAYGQAKRCAEFLACAQAEWAETAVKIARCYAFVGPHLPLDSGYAVGNFIGDALGSGPIIVRGDGTSLRSYMYAADLATWLWAILLKGEGSRPYNVGSDHAVSVAQLAHEVAGLVRPPVEVRVLGDGGCGGGGRNYVPDVSRARHELGLQVTYSLQQALSRTYDWHVAAPPSTHGDEQR